jgi:hypothetical protein
MSYILLKIETGTWLGGNDGKFPKLVEWELGNLESPVLQSDGWGHGLGGSSSSLCVFSKDSRFVNLSSGSSSWAYKIISDGLANNLSVEEIEAQLYSESKKHKVELPERLKIVLNSRVRWVNA